jgi:Ca2+-binding RTX toxin-like protein
MRSFKTPFGTRGVGVMSSDLLAQQDSTASRLQPLAASGSISPLAVVSSFTATSGGGQLTVFGDNLDNSVTISRNAAGQILVNGGAVAVTGGTPTVANTGLIQIFGQGGNDVITINEANGALPRANLFGGSGNDTLTAGSGADMLFGQSGNDTLLGKGGNDFLFGGTENDVLTGGDGDDQVFGESGDDRMVWNPGDGTDLMEGGTGIDTAEVNGGNGAEVFTATANGTRVRLDRIEPAPFALDIGTTEKLVVNMNGGDDHFSATGNLAALIGVTVDGGSGNDTILGSNGVDLLIGGDGNDFIDGQQGNDVAFLGAGDDVFGWDPGDGSDTVEGQDGSDTLRFNGSAANELTEVSANGQRARFTRNIATIVMDLNDVEKIELQALAGADTLIVGDMSGTDITQVSVDLAGTIGGTSGDAAADTITSRGTSGNDTIDVLGTGSSVAVVGLAALLQVKNSEGANDALVVSAGGGNDSISAATLVAGVTRLTIDGGAGNDTLVGSHGNDVLIGGDGNDTVAGGRGNDAAFLGTGDDRFVWAPGDGSDTVEGQAGQDTLDFTGSSATENINLFANGTRALFTRDVAAVTMDLNEVERVEFQALGGTDNITVGDLTGTHVTQVAIELAGSAGGGDAQADTVTANATQGADTVLVSGGNGVAQVGGLAASIAITQAESQDRLVVNGQGGDDVLDARGAQAGQVALTLNGGLGNDLILGGAGDDLITGGDGTDTTFMGAGDDTFTWNPGDDNDTVEGQSGFDTLAFNGANVAERIDISANGERVRFTRDIAAVTMDLNDTEAIVFKAQGGADLVTVGDMSGTDLTEVQVDLRGAAGAGDAAADTVVLNGSNGDDVAFVFSEGNRLIVTGLAATVVIEGFEFGLDRLVINGLAGDDVIEGSGLGAGVLATFDGGAGSDILVGGASDDVLLGGAGDDVLLGGGGSNVLDGGEGDDIEINGLLAQQAPLFAGLVAQDTLV